MGCSSGSPKGQDSGGNAKGGNAPQKRSNARPPPLDLQREGTAATLPPVGVKAPPPPPPGGATAAPAAAAAADGAAAGGDGWRGAHTYDPGRAGAAPAARPIAGAFKVLSIGINYFGSPAQLDRCVDDAAAHTRFLRLRGFLPPEGQERGGALLRVLSDDQEDARLRPTRQNIVDALWWLVDGAQPGHALFLHYCGHGVRVSDASGADEALAPEDYADAGVVLDDLILEVLQRIPPGAKLTAVCDSCHSGSLFDLPWRCVVAGGSKDREWRWEQEDGARDLGCGQLVMLSGRTDAWHAADAAGAGALSHAWMDAMDRPHAPTLGELLVAVQQGLRLRLGRGGQMPCLSSSHRFDLQERAALGCGEKDRSIEQEALRMRAAGLAGDQYPRSPPPGGVGSPGSPPPGARRASPPPQSAAAHSPRRAATALPAGLPIDAWWYDRWYPGFLRGAAGDGTVDVDWDDAERTTTLRMDPASVRTRAPRGGAGEGGHQLCWSAEYHRFYWCDRGSGETSWRCPLP